MESVYRLWVRERCDGSEPEFLDELRRELHITLGTAKWQVSWFSHSLVSVVYWIYGDGLFRSWKSSRGP